MRDKRQIAPELVEAAAEGIVRQHDEEVRAFLRGDVAPGAWRPEKYAEAALRAALDYRRPSDV